MPGQPRAGAGGLAIDRVGVAHRGDVVGLRLPEEEEETLPMTRMQKFRRRLSEIWAQVAGV